MCQHESRVWIGTIMTYKKILTPSKSNSEVDLIFHYRELIGF